jgi:hypothetical protein
MQLFMALPAELTLPLLILGLLLLLLHTAGARNYNT